MATQHISYRDNHGGSFDTPEGAVISDLRALVDGNAAFARIIFEQREEIRIIFNDYDRLNIGRSLADGGEQ